MKSRLLAALTTLAFFTTSTPVHAVNAVTIDQAAEFARAVSQVFPVTVHYEPSGTIRLEPSAQPDPLSPAAIPQT